MTVPRCLPYLLLDFVLLEQQAGTVPVAQLPQFTLWYLSFSCQERSLGAAEDNAEADPTWDMEAKRAMPCASSA